jgi:hypothetical protein
VFITAGPISLLLQKEKYLLFIYEVITWEKILKLATNNYCHQPPPFPTSIVRPSEEA